MKGAQAVCKFFILWWSVNNMWKDMEFLLKVFKIMYVANICQARILPATRQTRLSVAESMPYYYYNNIDGHPGTYSFGYDVSDPTSGNKQFRTEERYPNGTVVGSYGYVDPSGYPHRFKYVSDERGYRVMKERPNNPSREQMSPPSPYQHTGSEYTVTESSITWARPSKRKNNNKPQKHQLYSKEFVKNPNYLFRTVR